MSDVQKYGSYVTVSRELMDDHKYGRFSRKVKSSREIPVPDEIMRAYREWEAAFTVLEETGRRNGWYWVEDSGIDEPTPEIEYEYAETVDEFHARVDAAIAEHAKTGVWPDDTKPVQGFIPDIWVDAVRKQFNW
jgi:hypothetical protein